MPRTVIPEFHTAQELVRFIADAHWVSLRTPYFTPDAMRFFDSRLSGMVLPLTDNAEHTQSFVVVVSSQYRDLHDPALDGDRYYRVVRVDIRPDGERVTTTADHVEVDGADEWDTRIAATYAAARYAESTTIADLEQE